MKRAIICTAIAFTLLTGLDAFLINARDNKKENIYHEEATVVATGQCNNNKCAITLKDSRTSEVKYSTSDEPVAVGRTMYKMCWYSKAEGNMCYVNYSLDKKTN